MKKYYFIIGFVILALLGSVLVTHAAEDFTTFYKLDPNNRITVGTNALTVAGATSNENAFTNKDFGSGYFSGTITHYETITMTTTTWSATTGGGAVWALSNTSTTIENLLTNGGGRKDIIVYFDYENPGGHIRIGVARNESANIAANSLSGSDVAMNTPYYLKIQRTTSGGAGGFGQFIVTAYSDPERTVQVGTRALDLGETATDYQYLYAVGSRNNGDTNTVSYSVQSLSRLGAELPAFQILYPASSTDYIHDFTTWTYNATNTDSTSHEYNFKILLDTTSTFSGPTTFTKNVWYVFNAYQNQDLSIPNTQYLATSTLYYAKLCVAIDRENSYSCATPITFHTGDYPAGQKIDSQQAGFNNSTTTEVGVLFPPIAPAGLVCGTEFYNPGNWACWAVKGVSDFVTLIQESFKAGVTKIFTDIGSVFPISTFVQLNSDIEIAKNATTSITGYAVTGQGNFMKDGQGGYVTYDILSSTTFDGAKTPGGFDVENLIVEALYALMGIIIIGTGWLLLHQSSKPK